MAEYVRLLESRRFLKLVYLTILFLISFVIIIIILIFVENKRLLSEDEIKYQEIRVELEEIKQKTKKTQYPSIEDLELSVRSHNCLKRAGIDSVEKLLQYSEDELLDIRNFGQKSIQEVKNKIKELGLSFKKK